MEKQNLNSEYINKIFIKAIEDYHTYDNVEKNIENPFIDTFDKILYEKCWIDSVQWHYEDLIRDPFINPEKALEIKRAIDKLNQQRTDLVEQIDDFLFELYKDIPLKEDYRINTESIGWAIDRLSILNLKVYHWNIEANRTDCSEEYHKKAVEKLNILINQLTFLSNAIDNLIKEVFEGKTLARPFKQMKMYNDAESNPILRKYKNNYENSNN